MAVIRGIVVFGGLFPLFRETTIYMDQSRFKNQESKILATRCPFSLINSTSDLYGPEPVPISGFVSKFSCSLICDSHGPEPARKPSI